MKPQFPNEASGAGEFERQEDEFRAWLPAPAQGGRYHLYVSYACPWANRTMIVRKLKKLEHAVSMTVVDPIRDERGWAFRPGPGQDDSDPVNGFTFLREAYAATDANFNGRVTVPVLWDKQERRIVNNSEDDICGMFNSAFPDAAVEPDLFPSDLEDEQKRLSAFIYEKVNNGVYRAGFATRQRAYERACLDLFAALDELEKRLSSSRYLFGDRIVETDWRLFCTLIRFDAVYHGHFKCNIRRIVDYPNLNGYLMDLYQHPGVAELVNFDHIKRHYYMTHDEINPTRIVPVGPELNLLKPHGREQRP
ncbi:MAG TPA: glutathione S-transferase family protein [Verrucomicrobiae bacterium]|nr:glutathione S-transferase family protein [Verrucomicrobiae bacterium]